MRFQLTKSVARVRLRQPTLVTFKHDGLAVGPFSALRYFNTYNRGRPNWRHVLSILSIYHCPRTCHNFSSYDRLRPF